MIDRNKLREAMIDTLPTIEQEAQALDTLADVMQSGNADAWEAASAEADAIALALYGDGPNPNYWSV